jgi:phage I-like protein
MSKKSLASSLIEIQANGDLIPLFPAGTTKGFDGRGPYHLRDTAAVIAASKRGPVDLVIDRDHATDLLPKGTPVKAAGWIKEIVDVAGALFAKVDWTPEAEAEIKNKEYRYISPVFQHDKNGVIQRVLRASLTNSPNFNMKALASAEADLTPEEETDTMNKHLLALASILALTTAFTTDEQIETAAAEAIKGLQADQTALASIRTKARETLKLDDKADDEKIISTAAATFTAAETKKPDPSKFVPIEAVEELKTSLASLQKEVGKNAVEEVVTASIKDGKVTPAQKGWATDYASTNLEGFKKYLETAPVLVTAGEGKLKSKPTTGSEIMDEDDKAIASMLGVSEEDFKKTAKAFAA